MYKSILLIIAVLTSFSYADTNEESFRSCFHGWISQKGNAEPTGYCKSKLSSEKETLFSRIEIDFPTQHLYIHGNLRADEKTYFFHFKSLTCKDSLDGWTTVEGVNTQTGETYFLKHRELKEIPATGQAKQAFEGEADLSVELSGKTYNTTLTCTRYIF